ncbi:hypothetical protein BB559_007428 [Furculomyces boomerangus]|uniref:Ubiquitin-related modifier 1 n=2 Tax=Harpellales TaxID=61421 RepID=A0A2T9XXG9_9FUNG|nr:hypothetical protein BB559_007428 [Furculomyces boomerangus]PVZ97742.1 hypothetical protein BB558_006293 [Smittium angustum]
MNINVEFSGGMELLFGGVAKKTIQISPTFGGNPAKISDMIIWLKDNLLTENVDLFIQGDSIRPGILVLINEVDWELEDGPEYELSNNDTITFISTLHGG